MPLRSKMVTIENSAGKNDKMKAMARSEPAKGRQAAGKKPKIQWSAVTKIWSSLSNIRFQIFRVIGPPEEESRAV